MRKPTKDPIERKTVAMQSSIWRDIAAFREKERIATEAEAHRRIVIAGLRALAAKESS
jgi:hypothetical protein